MRPNDKFKKYFPEVETPEEKESNGRSSCLRTGSYLVISEVVRTLGLDQKLVQAFGAKDAGKILDLAAYSVVTENNATQYYPEF